jgi:hypothetical protein
MTRIISLIELGRELKELGERFNRMAHGDFSDFCENWFEGNYSDFITREQLQNSKTGSYIL